MKIAIKNIESTFRELKKELEKEGAPKKEQLVQEMVKELVNATPIDTGFAKSSWSYSKTTYGFLVNNSAPYIEYLNAGTSLQAPSHFIETIALKYGRPYGMVVEVLKNE
jgi:hypothetical protein